MIPLKNYSLLLGHLYKNELEFVEEISIIERMYLYPDIKVFVDNQQKISSFLLMQRNLAGHVGAYMKIGDNPDVLEKMGEILSEHKKLHIQSDLVEKKFLADKFRIAAEYQYLIMKMDSSNFRPLVKNVPVPTRITTDISPKELKQLSGNNPNRFREEIRHGIFYGFKKDGEWISFSGAGVMSRNCMYIYVHTEPEYRGKKLGKICVSKVVDEIIKAGRQPVYALDPTNIPSMKIAQSLGFEPYMTKECLYVGRWEVIREDYDDKNIPDSSFYA